MSGGANEPVVVDQSPQPSPPQARGFHALARWLYTNNPFYVISAALVFAGLWISFGPNGESGIPWGLAGGLAGYVVLLTVTSCLLARYARVWNDIRSMLLLIVLMLVALSLAFDETLTENPERGALLNLGALAFAVAISETILGSLAIKFPVHYRLPYYLLLMIFFVYPARVACWHFVPGTNALHWVLLGFGVAVAAALLTLLPAARRGPTLVARNGTPWPWPLFPWSVFFILALCACGRAYFLCVSLDFVGGSANVFGLYFLVPIWLAAALLVLELGLEAGHHKTITAALAMALVTPLLAFGGSHDVIYQQFIDAFTATLWASPLAVTSCAVVGFFALATVRRVPGAADLLTLSLVMLGLQNPFARLLRENTPLLATAILLAAAGVQAWLAVRRRSSLCAMTATLLVLLAGGVSYGDKIPHGLAIGGHALILASLAIAAVFDDEFARRLRRHGWLAVVGMSALPLLGWPGPWPAWHTWFALVYPLAWLVLAVGYGWLLRQWMYHFAAGVIGTAWVAGFAWKGYQLLRLEIAGLDYLAGGLLCFAVAVVVSLAKAGLAGRWLSGLAPRTAALAEAVDP